MKKFEELKDYKQLSESELKEFKQALFELYVELKSKNPQIKPKEICNEVIKRFNVSISPQTLRTIIKKEKWDKKLIVAKGMGYSEGIKETVIDENSKKIDLRKYEIDLFKTAKDFFKKRFVELQMMADELYDVAKQSPPISKERWKALTTYFMIHDRQMEMLKMIGIEEIFKEYGMEEASGIDMNKIIELYEIAKDNAKIIEEMIEKNKGNIIEADYEEVD